MKPLYRNLALFILVITSLFFRFSNRLPTLFNNPAESRIVKEGISIVMDIAPIPTDKKAATGLREGQHARLQFTIHEEFSKEPVKGLHPAVWLERQNPQEKDLSCKERINSYLQSKLAFQPDINFNSYFVLALNNKASISVIDPINGFGGSKLITRIRLNSPGVDWVLSKDHKRLYVVTPLTRQVAVIDTETWKVTEFLPFDSTPTQVALQPDGKYLWVGLEAADKKSIAGISAIDTENTEVSTTIKTGAGHHEFAFSDDSRTAYVSNAEDQTIAVIDTEHLSNNRLIKSSGPPVSLAFSALSKSVYAATENGRLLIIDANGQSIADIDTGSPLKALRFSADGRWGFAVSQIDNKVFIIDASLNRLAQTVDVGTAPDQISFTDNFAYIRSTGNETVAMLELKALDNKTPVSVTSFPGGQTAPGQSGLLLTDAIVPTPERNAVVVANPADKTVYYYMEGMAAPMGNFENSGLNPMAVMVVNRSMQETSPGFYTGTAQLPSAGRYSVSILLDTPPVYHCFAANIAPDPRLAKQSAQPVTVDYLFDNKEVAVGKPVSIKVKLSHPDSERVKDGVTDLQVLIFRVPGLEQQRMLAKPLGNSIYQVDITPPESGVYQVFVQSASLNFTFEQQPMLTFRAIKPETETVQLEASEQ